MTKHFVYFVKYSKLHDRELLLGNIYVFDYKLRISQRRLECSISFVPEEYICETKVEI